MTATLTVTQPEPGKLTVVVEADPPIPLLGDGSPDVDSARFRDEHAAVILAADYLAKSSGESEWKTLVKGN